MSSIDQNIWSSWIVPPVAAGAAIVPTYYGFAVKTAQQLGQPIPKMGPVEALRGGCRLAPTVSGLVGLQMILQNGTQQKVQELMGHGPNDAPVAMATDFRPPVALDGRVIPRPTDRHSTNMRQP